MVTLRLRAVCLLLLSLMMLQGCARGPNPQDPYEPINRRIFAVNQRFDKYLMKPVAGTYNKLLPWPVRLGVHNFFENLLEVQTITNGLLQLKPSDVVVSSWRFVINSTFGLAGTIDVAKHMGLEKHYQDFGLTLAHYGVTRSAYFERPLVGPSTIRDTIGTVVDGYLWGPFSYYTPYFYRHIAPSLYTISVRSGLLAHESLMQTAAIWYPDCVMRICT